VFSVCTKGPFIYIWCKTLPQDSERDIPPSRFAAAPAVASSESYTHRQTDRQTHTHTHTHRTTHTHAHTHVLNERLWSNY
jgi:ABC-type nickel/cobalt efflux system permease component RcnA